MTDRGEAGPSTSGASTLGRSEAGWIASEGWPVMAVAGLLTILLTLISLPLGCFALGLLIWLRFILRVPSRRIPVQANLILAPVDGVIVEITKADPEGDFGQTDGPSAKSASAMVRVSIRTALTDAQLQLTPIASRVSDNFLIPGLFGSLDNLEIARRDNERREITLETDSGDRLLLVQIGSNTARKLVCRHAPGKFLSQGTPIGMACIGGLTELYLPASHKLQVEMGQRMVAGETVLGRKAA